MYKALYLYVCLIMDPPYFLQRHFPGGDYPAASHFLHHSGPVYAGHCHLGAGMKLQPRKMPAHESQGSQILDDDTVQSPVVIGTHVVFQLLQLIFLEQGIDCHIQTASVQMHIVDCLQKPLFIRVIRVGPGSEPAAPHIDRVSSCCHCCLHTVK